MSVPHSKRGWLVPAVLVVALGVAYAVTRLYRDALKPDMPWFFGLTSAFLVTGIVLIALGRRFRERDGRVLWDPRREKYTHLPSGDTFCWIDVGHWGWIVLAIGAIAGWSVWKDIPR
jgi:hypothetical protein